MKRLSSRKLLKTKPRLCFWGQKRKDCKRGTSFQDFVWEGLVESEKNFLHGWRSAMALHTKPFFERQRPSRSGALRWNQAFLTFWIIGR